MPTISREYLDIQKTLHENPHYGVASLTYAPLVRSIFEQFNLRSISDYGAGKCNLKTGLKRAGLRRFSYYPYDPVFPEYGKPTKADLVCCIDVLEHIEPELIDNVLDELGRITVKLGFFTVATGPAGKVLSDGRNAHLIQQPAFWWLNKLGARFEVQHLEHQDDHGFWVLVRPIGWKGSF